MKLKEKLAKEFSDSRWEHDDYSAFMAGFEKAREMAARLHTNNLGTHGMCDFSAAEGEHKFDQECLLLGEEDVTSP